MTAKRESAPDTCTEGSDIQKNEGCCESLPVSVVSYTKNGSLQLSERARNGPMESTMTGWRPERFDVRLTETDQKSLLVL